MEYDVQDKDRLQSGITHRLSRLSPKHVPCGTVTELKAGNAAVIRQFEIMSMCLRPEQYYSIFPHSDLPINKLSPHNHNRRTIVNNQTSKKLQTRKRAMPIYTYLQIKSIWSFDMIRSIFKVTQTRYEALSVKTMWFVLFFVSCTYLLVDGFGNEEILVCIF